MSNAAIVLVSHSEKVTEGIQLLLEQVVGEVSIQTAGGNEDGGIGTSLERIQDAIQNVGDGGAVVFYDLGSAKMNAEMAIEMLELENVHLSNAPILEGAYLAAVEASVGKSVEEILGSLEKEFGKSE
ncbi:dihydroxyacetone kinase phosphoryl donor subunit DhaM [Halobacillus sp. BBL2006]|uniref:dihydroxyacetone kinase phosphoryl donor subunit DhaM n=1 Tax=Halobacillus sp. BBL2006 TaxID=1543706 RepID=UPI000542EEEF|nr:dihydroxyacetone kinase phosphoryl donor subunit DhaM [Halobacillus sp. BBL2006]KHE67790.1 PTS mannose transporter subunit IID [Halobacillus sp. BBL2006]